MAEQQESGKTTQKKAGSGGEAAREKLPPAEGQEESLKVHGDKLEPRKE
jgi:hypothetical protein